MLLVYLQLGELLRLASPDGGALDVRTISAEDASRGKLIVVRLDPVVLGGLFYWMRLDFGESEQVRQSRHRVLAQAQADTEKQSQREPNEQNFIC